jgi:hypothetical protein
LVHSVNASDEGGRLLCATDADGPTFSSTAVYKVADINIVIARREIDFQHLLPEFRFNHAIRWFL